MSSLGLSLKLGRGPFLSKARALAALSPGASLCSLPWVPLPSCPARALVLEGPLRVSQLGVMWVLAPLSQVFFLGDFLLLPGVTPSCQSPADPSDLCVCEATESLRKHFQLEREFNPGPSGAHCCRVCCLSVCLDCLGICLSSSG